MAFSFFGQTTFPWNGTYGGSGTNRTYSTTVSGITMSATIVNSENVWQDASPVWFPSGSAVSGGGCSGIAAANEGMLLSTDWTSNATKTITVTITFSSPVQGPVNFKLYDVNDDGFGSWADKITISGTNSAAAAVNAFNVGTACVQTGGSVTGSGTTSLTYNSGNSTSCTCWGNNTINVGTASDCISTLTISYKSAVSPASYNNPKQYVVISNLTATVPPPLTAPTAITGNTSICQGQSTTLTATGGTATSQWYTGSCGGTLVGTGASITVSPTTATTYYVRNAGTSCTPASGCISVTVAVNPSPAMTSAPTASICSGSTLSIPLTSDFGTSYSWVAASHASVTGESTTPQTSATIDNTLVNTTGTAQTVNYTVTPSANGCSGTPQTIAVTVNPEPTLTNANIASACTGTALNIPLTANTTATFTWSATDNPNVTGESLTSQTSSTINNTLTNSTSGAENVVYSVTPTAGTCTGTPQTITVTVHPTPPAPVITPNGPTTFCPGGNVILTSGSTTGNTWSTNETSPSITVSSSGTYTLSYTDANGCPSPTASITITQTAGALPTATLNGGGSYCTGTAAPAVSVTVTGNGPWTVSYTLDGAAQTVSGAASPITLGNTAGTYVLTNVSDASCSNTATGTATITQTSTPAMTSPNTASACTGTALNIPLTASSAATFSWSATDNPNVTGESLTSQASSAISNTLTNTGTSAETVVYTVTPTAGSCAGTPQTVTVTVNPAPAAPTITPNGPTAFCPGGNVILTSGSATGNSWSTSETAPAITVSTPGTYTLSYTDANGCPSDTASIAITQTAGALPTATLSGGGSYCAGTNAPAVTATVTGNGPWTVDYTLDGVAQTAVSGASSPITVGNTAGTYILTNVSDASCSSSAGGTATITANPAPTVTVNDLSLCTGASGTITATPSASGGTYIWSPNGETSSSITVNPAATGTYLVVYMLGGCSSPVATSIVTVTPIPTVTVNSTSICANQTAVLTAMPSTAGGTYSWAPNGETTASISVSPATTSSYIVTYTVNGCVSSTATGTVTVNSGPAVSFTADQLQGCAPLTVHFTSSSNSDPNGCAWTLSNGATLSGCTASYTFNQPGCYDVALTATLNGCSNSSQSTSYICVEANPTAYFTATPPALSGDNSTVVLDNLSTGAVTYSWTFGDGASSTLFNPTHTYGQGNQSYNIILNAYSNAGCQSSYSISISYEDDLVFYVPNAFTPDGDQHNNVFAPVFTSGFDPFSYNLSIFDRWGEIIFESNNTQYGWDGTYLLAPGLVQDGIYVWKISFKLRNNDDKKEYVGHVNLMR